jgi:hypothetical protein
MAHGDPAKQGCRSARIMMSMPFGTDGMLLGTQAGVSR